MRPADEGKAVEGGPERSTTAADEEQVRLAPPVVIDVLDGIEEELKQREESFPKEVLPIPGTTRRDSLNLSED